MMKTSDAINTTALNLLEHLGSGVKDGLDGLKVDLVVENDEVLVRVECRDGMIETKTSVGRMAEFAKKIKYGGDLLDRKIPTIKFIMQVTGWDLKTAKEYMDRL